MGKKRLSRLWTETPAKIGAQEISAAIGSGAVDRYDRPFETSQFLSQPRYVDRLVDSVARSCVSQAELRSPAMNRCDRARCARRSKSAASPKRRQAFPKVAAVAYVSVGGQEVGQLL
jgi:hypothetical protein